MFQSNCSGLKSKFWLIKWVNKPFSRKSFKPIKYKIKFTQLTIRQILTKSKSINKLNNLLEINQHKIRKKHCILLKTSKWQIKKTQPVYLTTQREAASSTMPRPILGLVPTIFRESRPSKYSLVRPLTSQEDPALSTPVGKYHRLDPGRDQMGPIATTPRQLPLEGGTYPPKIVTFATTNLCPMPQETKRKRIAIRLTMVHLSELTTIALI